MLPVGSLGGTPRLRRLLGSLVIYHAMILLGAFFIIAGGSSGIERLIGAVLVGVGIAIEISILAWSASLTRAASTAKAELEPGRPALAPGSPRRVCIACGQASSDPAPTCPRCGRPMVSLGGTG